jgi:hypothetical protein
MPRIPFQIFIEDKLIDEARELSKLYSEDDRLVCGKRQGSASWYIRNAVLERMLKQGVDLSTMELTDDRIF